MLLTLALSCSDSGDNPVPPEDRPAISVQDQSVVEGNTALVSVSLDHTSDRQVTFSFATLSGTATSGSDFSTVSGTDTIPAGQTSATILVSTVDDAEVESAETFSVALSVVAGAEVARALATCTINDNDIGEVSFATQVRPLLKTSCAKLGTCHGGTFPGGGMFLDTSATYTNVISATGMVSGGLVVAAGNSASSTLYTKTTDTWGFGSRMPQAAAPLSLQQQALIRDWIDQGAQDN
jgi:hypothetical protein